MKFISKIGKWYVPIADLLNIYKDFYGYQPINATVLEECTGWLYLGRLGERLAVAKAFQSYSKKSSFLIEQFTSYFLGGLYDMAAWTSIAWNQTTIPMLEHGPQTCDLTYNPLYVTCSNTSTPFTRDLIKEAQERNENPQGCRNRHGLSERLEQVSGSLTLEDIKVSRTEHGVTFQPSDELQKLLDEVDEFMKTTRSPPLDASSAAVFSTSTNHSRLGWELASGDFNNDGIQDLALSAPGAGESNKPQHGRVFIVYGGKDKKFANMDLNTQANLSK